MTTPTSILPQRHGAARATRFHEAGPVVLLSVFAVMLLVLPSNAVIGFIGAIAFPAALAAIALAGLYLTSVLLGHHDPRAMRYPTRWTFAMLWATSLLSYLAAQRRALSVAEVNGADRFVLLVLAISGVAFVAAEGLSSVDSLLRVVRAAVWGGAACGLVALVQFWLSVDLAAILGQSLPGFAYNDALGGIQQRSTLNRVAGTTLHPIELGAVTALVLPLAVVVAVIDRDRRWWVRFVPLLLVAAGVPASVSRSAVLALLVALVVLVAQVGPVLRVTIMASLVPGLLAVFVAFPGLLRTMSEFILGAGTDASITTRTDDYAMVEAMARERPWFGLGGGTYLPTDLLRILDNTYLTAVVELGLVGLVVLVVWWFALPVVAAVVVRRQARDPRLALLAAAFSAGLSATAVSALTFDSLSFPTLVLTQALVVGLVGAAWRMRRHEAPLGADTPRTGQSARDEHAAPAHVGQDQEDPVDTLAVWSALRRNHRQVLPVVVLTLLTALGVGLLAPTTYVASSTLLVQPPPPAPTDEQIDADPALQGLDADNPFTRRFDPATMIAMMSIPLDEVTAREALADAGATGRFSVAQVEQYGLGTAFARVSARAGSPQEAVRTAQLVAAALQERLREIQRDPGPSERYLITAPVVQEAGVAEVQSQGPGRLVALVLALGLVGVVVAVSLGDATRQLRRVHGRLEQTSA